MITGVSSSIGTAIAREFIAGGWDVIGHYCSHRKKSAALEKAARTAGVKISFVQADFTVKSHVTRLARELSKRRVDCLVNNAGGYVQKKKFSRLTADDLTKTFMLNTFAPALISSAVFQRMKKNKFGRIVNISSIAAKYGGSEFSMHYGCAKRALEGLTKTLAREGAACNVLVNTVRPGVIDTEFHRKFSKNLDKRKKLIPLKRLGQPEDISRAVYFLGSEENRYLTNETIAVAGGE